MTRFRLLAHVMDLVPYGNAARVAALFPPGRGWLVDLGGGTGRVSRHFRGEFDRVLILDPQPAMLRKAAAKGLGFDLVLADARALPLKPGVADVLLATDAFHHMPEPERVLAEAPRALAPEGVLLLEEFDPRSLQGRVIRAAEVLARFGSHFHPPRELQGMVEAAGLHAETHRLSARDYVVRGVRRAERDAPACEAGASGG